MTQADKHFIETCKRILEEGVSSKGTNVRTRWDDGSEAHYISLVGVQNVYDVGKEFPMITLRNNSKNIYNSIDEILWIWQKKSNNVHELNSHIWDQWADETGSIKKAYGYQMAKKYDFKIKGEIHHMDQVDSEGALVHCADGLGSWPPNPAEKGKQPKALCHHKR